MHGRLRIFETRPTAQEAIGIFFGEILDEIAVTERHCRENMMACAALEEQINDGFVALARRPTNHVARPPQPSTPRVGRRCRDRPSIVAPCSGMLSRAGADGEADRAAIAPAIHVSATTQVAGSSPTSSRSNPKKSVAS